MKFNKAEKKELEEAKQLSRRLSSNLPKKIVAASLSYYSKLPFKAFSLREALIHRIAELSEVAVELFESEKLVSAIIMTRSVYETTSVLYWLYKSLEKVYIKKELGNMDNLKPELILKIFFRE